MSEPITVWRIASSGLTWKANDLSGKGSARHPGRWNSLDRPILYSSSSIALACLETVVHLAGDDPLPFQRQLVRITIPRQHWERRRMFALEERSDWHLPPTLEAAAAWLSATRAWGDAWLQGLESLIAEVPSVIVPEESNLLLNPRHPAHRQVVAEIVRPWVYDARLLPAARAAIPQAGPPWQQPLGGGVALEMVPIPAGEFLMGSPEGELGRSPAEGPQHRVRLAPFSMGRMPITQAQWRQVALWQPAAGEPPWERELDPEPAFFRRGELDDDQRPVERVSWFEAMEFCRRLSRRTGRLYTLPSEAQWEYACRAGTTTPYAFGSVLSERQANVRSSETMKVGSFPANAWGLHDMHGNVWEWCADHWHPDYVDAPNDGRAWIDLGAETMSRLLRGGSWGYNPGDCRSAYRLHVRPDGANGGVGFRVVCLPQGPSLNA
ncbi:SUMF1/EgtB/PvdO family nonheme iron enzyme [Cyanobium sp. FGCU-6]|nr:SUMF1/EgtB/PvdO family nonheme iron enzyme [Cyanobium sp. FGCU6]